MSWPGVETESTSKSSRHQVTVVPTTGVPGPGPCFHPLPLYYKPNMCEGLQQREIINKIHDTSDVMDASSLPSALTSSLVVAPTGAIHPDQL